MPPGADLIVAEGPEAGFGIDLRSGKVQVSQKLFQRSRPWQKSAAKKALLRESFATRNLK
jgi:hypothetical protein